MINENMKMVKWLYKYKYVYILLKEDVSYLPLGRLLENNVLNQFIRFLLILWKVIKNLVNWDRLMFTRMSI